jgi:hypothetical protein
MGRRHSIGNREWSAWPTRELERTWAVHLRDRLAATVASKAASTDADVDPPPALGVAMISRAVRRELLAAERRARDRQFRCAPR